MSTVLGVEFLGSVMVSSFLLNKENLPFALFVFVSTWYAFSYFRFKTCSISWKGANWRQHVLTVQVPDTPWHLHLVFTWLLTTYNTKKTISRYSQIRLILKTRSGTFCFWSLQSHRLRTNVTKFNNITWPWTCEHFSKSSFHGNP